MIFVILIMTKHVDIVSVDNTDSMEEPASLQSVTSVNPVMTDLVELQNCWPVDFIIAVVSVEATCQGFKYETSHLGITNFPIMKTSLLMDTAAGLNDGAGMFETTVQESEFIRNISVVATGQSPSDPPATTRT